MIWGISYTDLIRKVGHMSIKLIEINRRNWEQIISLKVNDEQSNFVASNLYSLVQAKYEPECRPLAIYNDKLPVGFIMYVVPSIDQDDYWIYRLMIDKNHQKKGYGKIAMQQVIDIIKQDKDYNKVYISFEPNNLIAKTLYERLGFISTGKIEDGEIVYVLNY